MHPLLLAAHAQGLGALGADNPFMPGVGGTGFDWNRLIQQGFDFGKSFLQAKYGKDAAKYGAGVFVGQQAGAGMSPEQLAALMAQQQQAYASGAITGEGIRIGNSVLSWPVLGLGVAALYLLQSKGYERRR